MILSLGSAIWCYLGNGQTFANYQIYAVTIIIGTVVHIPNNKIVHINRNKCVYILIIGIACSIVLVTSQALTTDFIGDRTHRGAFTFGLMSFTDKVSNGAVVMAVQSL